jgi:formylmethanofuran dehydrogenase subunit E
MKTVISFILFLLVSGGNFNEDYSWYYPEWVKKAKYNEPIKVLDTESALGRYSVKTKEIGLKDLVKFHGHLCDGLVISYIELKEVLKLLFPDGVIDRTDLRAVSKNGPCWVDAVMYLTGARINFKTLRIDNSIGDGFIVQRISTGEAYSVHLKEGVFPKEMAELEGKIKKTRFAGNPVKAEDINRLEKMAEELIRKLLNTPPSELLEIRKLENYQFVPIDLFGERTDVLNKNMPR